MPEFNIPLAQNDAIYASVINGGEVGWAPQGAQADGSLWISAKQYSIYEMTQSASLISSFSITVSTYIGVEVDTNGCIWHTNINTNQIIQRDQTGSIISSFSSPSGQPEGVAIDGNNCVWTTEDSGSYPNFYGFYKHTNGGSLIQSFAFPSNAQPGFAGIAFDSSQCLWFTNDTGSSIYKLDQSTSVISTFSMSNELFGITIDSNDSLWLVNPISPDYYIFKSNQNLSYVDSISSPLYTWDLGIFI